jgi:hypothetical protein
MSVRGKGGTRIKKNERKEDAPERVSQIAEEREKVTSFSRPPESRPAWKRKLRIVLRRMARTSSDTAAKKNVLTTILVRREWRSCSREVSAAPVSEESREYALLPLVWPGRAEPARRSIRR